MIETIKKEKTTEKAVNEVVNLKYNDYASEQKDEVKQIARINNIILLTAPTGSGKTKLITIDVMKSFDDRVNIILVPNVIQSKQNAKKYGMQSFTGNDRKIHSKYISATYDKAGTLMNILEEGKYKFNLYIDECHLMVDASGYRYEAIDDIVELAKRADKVFYMSATNYYMRDGIIKYDIELNMQPVEKRNNIAAAQILRLDPKNIKGSLVNEIVKASKPDNGRKTVLFHNDIKELEEIKKILISESFKDEEVAIIKSKDRTENDQEVFNNIISRDEIPEQTKIILTTSVLEVGTNIDTRNVNIFVYIPQANRLNFNRIEQQVARFRVGAGETSNNILKVCSPYREGEDKPIRPFNKIKKELREEVEGITEGVIFLENKACINYTLEQKNDFVKSTLKLSRYADDERESLSMGIIEVDEEKGIPVINEFKLQRRAIAIYERQFFYNIPEFKKELESRLNVDTWFDTVIIQSEAFKEEFKAIKQDSKDAEEKEQERIKEICKEIQEKRSENPFVYKVIDPEVGSTETVEDWYKGLKDTNVPSIVKMGEDMKIEPQDMINSIIENGDSIDKNKKQFEKYQYIRYNNEFPIGEEITIDEKSKNYKFNKYVYCRKVFDDVCKKQGRITQSKKLSFLIELVKHGLLKNYKYSIRGANQVCRCKKNDPDEMSKPLNKKDIDKLVMPIIALVYNVSDDKRISSLKTTK